MQQVALSLVCVFYCFHESFNVYASIISIRGYTKAQSIPRVSTKSWRTWTFEDNKIVLVENEGDEDGWVNPTSYDSLYFPSDLPFPYARPALGVVLANGIPRYIMPSIVLSLATPNKIWRNRGLCSLPRAKAWIDLFAEYTPEVRSLKLSCFGRNIENLKFLEDQDGSGAWNCLLETSSRTLLRPTETTLDVSNDFELFKKFLFENKESLNNEGILEGYHFIDIILNTKQSSSIIIPKLELKMFLTDILETKRFLEIEDGDYLNSEPCGELVSKVSNIGGGGKSKFLPKVFYL
jgi:hypothetical protein